MRRLRRLLLFSVPLLAPVFLPAQVPTLGDQLQVNTYTNGQQAYPSIAQRPSGEFVVVWESGASQDGDQRGVFGQRFDAIGQKLGSEFQVNSYTTHEQYRPSVGIDDAGDFVVTWESYYSGFGVVGQDGSGAGVFGQRFDAAGAKAGAEFQINTYTPGSQKRPAVAVNPDGTFVAVWDGYATLGQRFDAGGAKLGAEIPLSSGTAGTANPRIASDRAGNFVAVWQSFDQDGSGSGIFGQRFNAAGAKIGSEFPVNTSTAGDQVDPRIAVDRSSGFVVVWRSSPLPGTAVVLGQRFNASAEKVGPEFPVDSSTTDQNAPSVAFEKGGGFVVVWRNATAAGNEIFGQRYDRVGGVVGPAFRIDSSASTDQDRPAVAADTAGGFVVAWQTAYFDGSGYGVAAKRRVLIPTRLRVDETAASGTSSDVNGVFEWGETVDVRPTWNNVGLAKTDMNGNAVSFTGPLGTHVPMPSYVIDNGTNVYDTTQPGSEDTCSTCFQVHVTFSPKNTRPAGHWDAALEEDLTAGGSHVWTLHVGDSFGDVPRSQPFYKKIETLLHHGITSGCAGQLYCPTDPVPRDQMAIFIAKGISGAGALVPTTGFVGAQAYDCSASGHSLFSDVSPTASFCKHVHYLAAQNVTLGCDATHYCPSQTITRDAMASFIAKAVVAPAGGNAVPASYTDPTTSRSYSCVSGSANLHFTDVPVANPFCKHIHFLWAKGIVDGCTATTYCPGSAVARDAMAKFIANWFGLQLYGP